MRILFEFAKGRRLRFLSHLDMQRFMQRALRRSGLPVAYSQGYSPHMLISFASALAVGVTSACELLDVRMAAEVSEAQALAAFAEALPPDLTALRARAVPDTHPSLMARLCAADYEITLPDDASPALCGALHALLAENTVMAMRRTKSGESLCDIRPMLISAAFEGRVLRARLSLTERATLKPDLLLSVLCERAGMPVPAEVSIHRVRLLANAGEGLAPLMDA